MPDEDFGLPEDHVVAITGPVEKVGGNLVLLIPLELGGAKLATVAEGISEIQDGFLRVAIPGWLATKLNISEGTIVHVDNRGGKFNFHIAATH